MKKYLPIVLFVLLHSAAFAQNFGRNSNKSSIPYQGAYQRMATGSPATSSLEIRNGTLWASGLNSSGQLGTGNTNNVTTPVQIGTDNTWVKVCTSDGHTLALKSNGTLWAWGNNQFGQLGDGTTVNKNTPNQVGTGTNWVSIAGGFRHSTALQSNGTLWAWGDNSSAQLGDGTFLDKSTPTQIGTDSKWTLICAGRYHNGAIKSDGSLWTWGYNGEGQLGDGTTVTKSTPTQVGTGTNWVGISAGLRHCIGLQSNGTLWTWGDDFYGQLGNGTSANTTTPTQIGTSTQWKSIVAGEFHSVAIRGNGTLWAWGRNGDGQVGDGTTVNKNAPTQIGTDNNWVSAVAGNAHTLALKSTGALWAWGYNGDGRLLDGTTTTKSTPAPSRLPLEMWLMQANGDGHSIAIKGNGTLWTWGKNGSGQLGDSTTTAKSIPVQIGTDNKWISVAAGRHHNLALKSDGTLWTWGFNFYGQLGNGGSGNSANQPAPVQIGTDTKWTSIAAGADYSMALKSDGTLWSWGNGFKGALGQGGSADVLVPTQVGTDTRWVSISAGNPHSVALKSNGTLWAWGSNLYGQLGDGTNTDRNIPIQIGTDNKWTAVAAGRIHTLALKSDGSYWGWGYNFLGNLGNGNSGNGSSVFAPTQVGTDNTWITVSAGYYHTMLLKSAGTLWACGNNSEGELGDGTTTQRNNLTQISTGTGAVFIACGSSAQHSAIIKDTRSAICMTGNNSDGQLGNGTTTNSFTYNCSNSVCASYNLSTAAATTYSGMPLAGGNNRTDFQLNCTLASSITRTGASPIDGNATAKVFVDATVQTTAGGTPYVQRHFDIEPASNAATATAILTLYFTQTDFTNFNAARGSLPALPVNAADAANNKANLRVTQFHGVPAGGNAPANYPTTWSGAGPVRKLITPTSVVWDTENEWWTVSFPVTGFSGFFVSTNATAPLPLQLLAFTAKAQGTANKVEWSTASITEGIVFEVTRSTDGRNFEKMGSIAGRDKTNAYVFYDEQPAAGTNYYRLNITDPSGETAQSTVAVVNRTNSRTGSISLWPVPASTTVTISTLDATLAGSTLWVLDMQGRVMTTAVVSASTKLDVQNWPAGIYTLKFEDGTVLKLVKQ